MIPSEVETSGSKKAVAGTVSIILNCWSTVMFPKEFSRCSRLPLKISSNVKVPSVTKCHMSNSRKWTKNSACCAYLFHLSPSSSQNTCQVSVVGAKMVFHTRRDSNPIQDSWCEIVVDDISLFPIFKASG